VENSQPVPSAMEKRAGNDAGICGIALIDYESLRQLYNESLRIDFSAVLSASKASSAACC
jgi:hypothetical protein